MIESSHRVHNNASSRLTTWEYCLSPDARRKALSPAAVRRFAHRLATRALLTRRVQASLLLTARVPLCTRRAASGRAINTASRRSPARTHNPWSSTRRKRERKESIRKWILSPAPALKRALAVAETAANARIANAKAARKAAARAARPAAASAPPAACARTASAARAAVSERRGRPLGLPASRPLFSLLYNCT